MRSKGGNKEKSTNSNGDLIRSSISPSLDQTYNMYKGRDYDRSNTQKTY